jgi:multidrug efflux pump
MKVQVVDEKKPVQKPMIVATILTFLAIVCYFLGWIGFGNLLLLGALLTIFNVFVLRGAIRWFQNVFLVKLEGVYERTLKRALKGYMPYLFFGGTVLLLVFSLVLLYIRAPKILFFPDNQPALVNVFIEKPIGTDIEATNNFVDNLEDDLFAVLEPYEDIIESVITQIGEGTGDPLEGPSQASTPHKAKITIGFLEYQFRNGINTNDIMEQIRDLAEGYPGVLVTVDKQRNGPPVGKPINIEVTGENFDNLISNVNNLREHINESGIEGIEELKTDLELGNPEVIIDIDREKARRFGLSTSSIANELRTALFGLEVSKFKEGEDDYPIQLRLADEFRYDIGALMNKKISFRDKFGNLKEIPIASVAEIEYSSTYGSVKRKDLDRVITMSSNVNEGFNATEINNQIKTLLQDYELPEDISVKFTGEQEEQAKSAEFLFRALIISVSLIFLIIVAQFNSVTTPFIIMASVVFSTIGVFLGLVFFNMDFVIIMTGIGIISLAGVVVNNAIVLIDYTNLVRERKREELGIAENEMLSKEELMDSIIQGGKIRLRPVLLTAITTVLGLIPLALGMNIDFQGLFTAFDPQFYVGGDNADFWGPMAWTVIFGLTFATFLTLVIVPVMYLLADKLNTAFRKNQLIRFN